MNSHRFNPSRVAAVAVISALTFVSTWTLAQTAPPVVAPKAVVKQGSERWEKEIAAYEAADKQNPPKQGGVGVYRGFGDPDVENAGEGIFRIRQ